MTNIRVIEKLSTKSAADKLRELADTAEAKPDEFQKFVLIHHGDMPDDVYFISQTHHGCSYLEAIGLLEMGKSYMGTSN